MRSVDEDNSAESHNAPVIIHEPERRETAQTQDKPQELLSEPQVTIYTGDSVIGDSGNEQAPQESSAANLQAKDVLGDITNIVNNYTLADEDIQDHGTAIDSQGPENHPVDDFVESFASVQLPDNEPTVRSTFESKFWGSWQTTAHNLHDRVSTLLEAVYQQFCLLLIKLATRYPKFGILLRYVNIFFFFFIFFRQEPGIFEDWKRISNAKPNGLIDFLCISLLSYSKLKRY